VTCGRSYSSRTTRGAGVAGSTYDESSTTHACRSPVDVLTRQPFVDTGHACGSRWTLGVPGSAIAPVSSALSMQIVRAQGASEMRSLQMCGDGSRCEGQPASPALGKLWLMDGATLAERGRPSCLFENDDWQRARRPLRPLLPRSRRSAG
jgi:hypothetical protein